MNANTPATATQIAAAVREGSLRPEQIVEAALQRIRTGDPRVNAFAVVRADAARAEARALAERSDVDTLPLAGVPIAIKNNIDVAGEVTRSGRNVADDQPAAADHPIVARLRAAGAVVVGITELPELGLWGTTDRPGRITRCPWNVRYTAGGSSGGSGAAVGAGLVPVAHGNDGLGSVRIPAACCGVVGVKPGRGLAPAQVGPDDWFGLVENGVLATTVADAAAVLAVMADRPSLAELAPASPLCIGLALASPLAAVPVDPHCSAAARTAARSAATLGHTVRSTALPYSAGVPGVMTRWLAGAAGEASCLANQSRLQPRTRTHVALGRAVTRLGLVRQRQVDVVENRLLDLFDRYDVVITPTLACPQPAAVPWHARSWVSNLTANIRYAPFTALWNLVGWPALSIPMGLHPVTGTPLAAQLAGPPGTESTLLRLATQLAETNPWTPVAPGL